MKNYIREVIDSYTEGRYPPEIDRQFRAWLLNGEHSAEKERELLRLWEKVDSDSTPDFGESLRRMRTLTGIDTRRRVRKLNLRLAAWRIAASVALVACLASVWLLSGRSDGEQPVAQIDLLQAYTPKAEMRTIILPDGTVVMVNAQSTLLYPQEFTGSTRSVYLSGEANFKVHPDPLHPFIVKSADFQVTALGTEFNVAAYPDEDQLIATLLSGKVLVECDNMSQRHNLMPGQQLAYSRSSRSARVCEANLADATAWQRGEIVMRSMTADEIFTRLGRRYPFTFVYSPHSLKPDRFTLTFASGAPLEEVMDIIVRVMGDISYRIEADRCYIMAHP